MSRLGELLCELCPEGVEYKELEQLCEINTGTHNTKDASEDGKYIFYVRSQEPLRFNSFDYDDKSVVTAGDGVGVGKDFHRTNGKYALHQRAYRIHPICENEIDLDYLYHYFCTYFYDYIMAAKYTGSVASIRLPMLKAFRVAVPPVIVQREIVRVLDIFAEITESLIGCIEQEGELKRIAKQQYIEQIINDASEDEMEEVLLQDISEFVTVGIANSATHAYVDNGIIMFRNQNIKENYLDDTDLIYISPDFAEKYKAKALKTNDILVTRTGYPGQACVVPEQFSGSQTFTTLIVRLKNTEITDPYYICYYINSPLGKKYVEKMKTGAAQQNFGAKALEKMPIKLPSLEKQKTAVRLIKRIIALFDEIISLLPSEIKMRKQQYEYYRKQLLSFEELSD